ncbi:MAG: efflux RND transporter periplasmic adaptor subunit [Syntrophotaleaceae bacterium]
MNRLLLPLLLLVLLSGCRDQNAFVAPPPPTVTVAPPVQKPVTFYARYTGQTEAVESVEIRARVEGYLESIHFRDADLVKKGDLLFEIDPRPYQARLDEATALLATRRAELHLAESTLQRKESALQDQAVSEVEVLEARAIRDQALAAIEAAKAAIETARLDLSYTRIFAPINGRIGRRLVDVGNLVGAAEKTLLATIVNVEPSYVYFNVNERDLLKFRNGDSAKPNPTNGNGKTPVFLGLSNDVGYPWEGRVDFTDNRVDPETGTIQVRGVFPNKDGALLPGLFARVQIPTGTAENALLVPERALGIDQQGYYLLSVDKTDTVEYRPVKVGPQVDDLRVIESGISASDRVIVNGLQRARPGITVNPIAPEKAAASAQTKAPQAG